MILVFPLVGTLHQSMLPELGESRVGTEVEKKQSGQLCCLWSEWGAGKSGARFDLDVFLPPSPSTRPLELVDAIRQHQWVTSSEDMCAYIRCVHWLPDGSYGSMVLQREFRISIRPIYVFDSVLTRYTQVFGFRPWIRLKSDVCITSSDRPPTVLDRWHTSLDHVCAVWASSMPWSSR